MFGPTGLIHAGQLVCAFLASVVLARALGPEALGVYAVALAIANVFAVSTRLGFATLAMRETAAAGAGMQWGTVRGLWRWILNRAVLTALGIVAVATTALLLAWDTLGEYRASVMLAALPIIPFLGLGQILSGMLRGLQRVVWGVVPELLVRPGLQVILFAGALAAYGHGNVPPVLAMALGSAATAVFFIAALLLLVRCAPPDIASSRPDLARQRHWVLAFWPLTASVVLIQVNEQSGVFLMGALRSDAEAGIHRVMFQLALLSVYLSLPFYVAVQPLLARHHARGDTRELQRAVTLAARGAGIATALLCLVVFVAGETIIGLLFGSEFVVGIDQLRIMLVGQLLGALCGPGLELLTMTKGERQQLRCMIACFAVNLTIGLLLVQSHGGEGIAVGIAVSQVIYRAGMAIYARRLLGIDATAFARLPR